MLECTKCYNTNVVEHKYETFSYWYCRDCKNETEVQDDQGFPREHLRKVRAEIDEKFSSLKKQIDSISLKNEASFNHEGDFITFEPTTIDINFDYQWYSGFPDEEVIIKGNLISKSFTANNSDEELKARIVNANNEILEVVMRPKVVRYMGTSPSEILIIGPLVSKLFIPTNSVTSVNGVSLIDNSSKTRWEDDGGR